MEKNSKLKERVTLKDIAEVVGITVNSVSKALRNSPNISPKTIARVKEVANQLGYIPDLSARSLRNVPLKVVAVVYDNIVNPYFAIMNNHLNNELRKADYRPMVFFETNKEGTLSLEVAREIISFRMSGVISYVIPTKEVIELFEDHNTPIVLLGRTGNSLGIDSVASNDYRGGKLAGYKLFDLGGKNFGYLGVTQTLNINNERLAGFLKALKNNGVTVPLENIIHNDTRRSTYELMDELDVVTKKIDSIFCFNDQIAFEVIGYLREKNIKVPEDVNIIGFDNLQSDIIYPLKLTTIDGDKPRAAHLALSILFTKLKDQDNKEMTGKIVDVSLVEGHTTKKR
ncbi:MAG: LacI family DNA-binding transcriptional regulator [Bacilli bacterium]|nr:LacI family DNA-binding transcriptional regulator [Bacilli bacterium]